MNYKTFDLEDWIAHINGAIEDERGLDGNEMRDLVAFLSKMPRWTPISKGLPKKNTEVLATTEWSTLTIAEMYGESDWFLHEDITNAETDEKIVAWMSLPEPYKSENKK